MTSSGAPMPLRASILAGLSLAIVAAPETVTLSASAIATEQSAAA